MGRISCRLGDHFLEYVFLGKAAAHRRPNYQQNAILLRPSKGVPESARKRARETEHKTSVPERLHRRPTEWWQFCKPIQSWFPCQGGLLQIFHSKQITIKLTTITKNHISSKGFNYRCVHGRFFSFLKVSLTGICSNAVCDISSGTHLTVNKNNNSKTNTIWGFVGLNIFTEQIK